MNALLRGLVRSDSVTTACKIAGYGVIDKSSEIQIRCEMRRNYGETMKI